MTSMHSLLGLALAAAAAASLVVPPAATADVATCTFSAVVNLRTPIRNLPQLGGDAEYSLSGPIGCVYTDATGQGAGTAYETNGTIVSSGLYRNQVCLSGWIVSAWDNPVRPGATTLNFFDGAATDVAAMRYAGRLTAGTGPFAIRDVNGDPTHAGSGSILLADPSSGSCTQAPGVSQLEVAGEFAIAL